MTNMKPKTIAPNSGAQMQKTTKKQHVCKLSPEAHCLLDIEVYRFWNDTRTRLNVRAKTVRVFTYGIGYSYIQVYKVLIKLRGEHKYVYADVKTGTLYDDTGNCLSSNNRCITNWRPRCR